MKGIILNISLLLLLPLFSFAQKITYSALVNENSRDMDFEILGKVSGNILIFKNQSSKYAISVYQEDMVLKDKVVLDFIMPSKTFNVDFVTYPDFFYMIYEFQKKGTVYCMAAKMDGNAKKMSEPVLLDTTHVGAFGDNKIYTVISSEDKQKIMVYKIEEKDGMFNFVTLLYDNQMQLIHKTRYSLNYNYRNDIYSDFHLDNEGNLIFTRSVKLNNKDDIAALDLITKAPLEDTFSIRYLDLANLYIDEVKIKIDNVNKRYLLNSFYYVEQRGNIEGIYSFIWDVKGDSTFAALFTPLADSIRSVAKESGGIKYAFNDYFIRKIILKKDGGYILAAEDYSKQSIGGNTWNRSDYLYPSRNNNGYYSGYYGGIYSPYYYYIIIILTIIVPGNIYYNILVLSISNKGVIEWSNIIHKTQSSDNTDNFLSFITFNSGAGIHFLYNSSDKRDPLLIENVISADGKLTRNPTLKNNENGYDFMIRFAKKTGARQLVVPCAYRGELGFAKIDF